MEERNQRWKAAIDEAWPPELQAQERASAARAWSAALACAFLVATFAIHAVLTHPRLFRKAPTQASTREPKASPYSGHDRPPVLHPWTWTGTLRFTRLLSRAHLEGAGVLVGTGGACAPVAGGIVRQAGAHLWSVVAEAPNRRGRLANHSLLGARAGRSPHPSPAPATFRGLPVLPQLPVPASVASTQDFSGTPLEEILTEVRQEAPYAQVTSEYDDYRAGHRRAGRNKHGGYDIGLAAGTAVPAAWPGRVVEILPWGGSEHGITVAVGDVKVTYGHLIPRVRLGQLVHTGMPLGLVARDHVDIKMRAGNGFVDFGKENPFVKWPWEGSLNSTAGCIRTGERAARWWVEHLI